MSQLRSIQPIKNGLGLRELQAVLAVAELGSFRRAAAALGYTQSALSHQVSALEAALEQPLFHRPGGRAPVRLTPAGEAVCRRARRALSEVEAVAADAEQAARGEIVRVRVGVTQTAAAEIMPAALRAFRDDHPGVEVVLTAADDTDASRAALRRGDLDLAFSYDPETDEYVEAIAVLADPWVILTRRDSAIASLERPGFGVLDRLDLVAWTRRWPAQAELEDTWTRRGIAPRIVYRTDDNLALQRLVAAGLGHACIGRVAASRAIDPALTWLEPHEPSAPRTIALCYPRDRPVTATARSLITAIRAQAPDAPRHARPSRSSYPSRPLRPSRQARQARRGTLVRGQDESAAFRQDGRRNLSGRGRRLRRPSRASMSATRPARPGSARPGDDLRLDRRAQIPAGPLALRERYRLGISPSVQEFACRTDWRQNLGAGPE